MKGLSMNKFTINYLIGWFIGTTDGFDHSHRALNVTAENMEAAKAEAMKNVTMALEEELSNVKSIEVTSITTL